jgi:hypothetical protein
MAIGALAEAAMVIGESGHPRITRERADVLLELVSAFSLSGDLA